jgi:hypothetical protein
VATRNAKDYLEAGNLLLLLLLTLRRAMLPQGVRLKLSYRKNISTFHLTFPIY